MKKNANKRDEQVKAEIKKKEDEKKKMLADTKDERMKKKEAQKKRNQELKVQREKEKVQKAKEFEEKKREEMEELERKQKEEEDRERKRKEKFEKENKEFLKQQAKKIKKDFKEMIQEKKSIQEAEKEYEDMESKLKENMKKKMEKYFEENKDSLKKEKEEKEAIVKFMVKKPVAAVFTKYDDQLKYYFDHYARTEHHALSRDFEKEYETLSFKEFKRFAYECNIIPTLMPVQEITYIYNQLLREKLDLEPDSLKAIDYDHFKKAVVRISAVGQSLLGGQNGPKFEKKMEEVKAKEDEDEKKKNQTIKLNATKTPAKNKPNKAETKDDLEREDDDPKARAKSSKKPDRKEGTLMERGAKPPREKIVIQNPKEDKLKNATIIKGKLDDDSILNKKSHRINKLLEIDSKAQAINNLQKVKVDNIRVSTECDVSIISDKTIEAFLKFIGLDQNDGEENKRTPQQFKADMDKKLNAKKLNVVGAKPNKFKKQDVPDKYDILDKFDSDEEIMEGEGDDNETNKKNAKDS